MMSVTMEMVDIQTLPQGHNCDVCHHGNGGYTNITTKVIIVMSVTMETMDIKTLPQGQDYDVCHHGNCAYTNFVTKCGV